jgi:hypothetical protein
MNLFKTIEQFASADIARQLGDLADVMPLAA